MAIEVAWHYARHNGRNKDSLKHAIPSEDVVVQLDAAQKVRTVAGWVFSPAAAGVALCGRFVKLNTAHGFEPEVCIECQYALDFLNAPQ